MKQLFIIVLSVTILFGCQVKEGSVHKNSETNEVNVGVEEIIEEKDRIQKEIEKEEEENDLELNHEENIEEEINEEKRVTYEIDPVSWKVIPTGASDQKVVLLTIDDAPDLYSVDMAEKLKELSAGAIFFVNGHFLKTEEDQQKLKRIHDLGFEIGNHTMNHPNMSQLSEQEQRKEISELNDLIENIIGERPRFYRAPFGVNTDESKEIVNQEGMVAMNWTYGYDWEQGYQEAEALAGIMVQTPLLQNGANILMHDRKWTLEALEDIVIRLREKGYEPIHPKQIIN
jgi:peptidoglycan/xylan/chitin deacetylase (PgdA/CDA1 family)